MQLQEQKFRLVKPNVDLASAYISLLEDFHSQDDDCLAGYVLRSMANDFEAFIKRLKEDEDGTNLAPGIIPQSTYWLVRDDGYLIGESRVRHSLTSRLEQSGGHVGLFVRPSERGRGYGTLLLKLTLREAKTMGLKRVLITCGQENKAALKIIENNNGKRDTDGIAPLSGRPVMRYWFEV